MAYLPISDHGFIGNMRTAALVGTDGTVDWMCYPRFDSPSVFASILDDEKGGSFRIAPKRDGIHTKQFYWPETNVLVTRFFAPEGLAELHDFMPVGEANEGQWQHQLVRRLRVLQGTLTFELACMPAFDYARAKHTATLAAEGRTVIFASPALTMALESSVPLEIDGGTARAHFRLQEGDTAVFVFRGFNPGEQACGSCPDEKQADELFESTVKYWQKWISRCTYKGRWREHVQRSALALKLLTHEPSGAIIAAPTCGLPERIGGERNWDYRYMWVRDAAFTVYAFMRIGFTQEATAFMRFLKDRASDSKHASSGNEEAPLGLLYTLDGERATPEFELPHLSGYRDSRPVRIGNAASSQLQLDIYGELIDAVYLFNKYAMPLSYDAWCSLRTLTDWVARNWDKPDSGIWEPRVGPRHNTHSKLMCWVALDRALRLAEKRSFPCPREEWIRTRDAIYEKIFDEGWSDQRGAFVQTLGGNALDASLLLMPLVLFVSADDPRMLKTIDAIRMSPKSGGLAYDCLVRRYRVEDSPDGLEGEEGTFNMCSFWLVEALTRAGKSDKKRLSEARLMFEKMLGFGNHLGLFAEQTGTSGEALGNFPQAFTHLALISAAFNLDRALG